MRDPEAALLALALLLVVGSVTATVGARRADRRTATAGPSGAAAARRGEWSLVLEDAGAKKVQVIKELRAIAGLGLAEAKALADRAPSTVLAGVDHASAGAAYRILAEAGATVRITERAAPSNAPLHDAAGAFTVVMDAPGPRRIQVIKEIRGLTGLGLAEAKRLTDRMPSTILSGVDHATAAAARDILTAADAAVRITED
jgi:ribosomal protein L7/L12